MFFYSFNFYKNVLYLFCLPFDGYVQYEELKELLL